MALGKSRRRTQKAVPPKLMLTSMMDMFTIILIFLLFSFSEDPETLKLTKELELPESNTESEYNNSVKIVLSKKDLTINDEIMATVENGQLNGINPDNLKASSFFQRLQTFRIQAKSGNDTKKSGGQAPHILFMCDKEHSFKTINTVIKAAGLAGYPNFQFAVLQEKQRM